MFRQASNMTVQDFHRELHADLILNTDKHGVVLERIREWLFVNVNSAWQLTRDAEYQIVIVSDDKVPKHPALYLGYGQLPPAIALPEHKRELAVLSREVFLMCGITEVIINSNKKSLRTTSWWDFVPNPSQPVVCTQTAEIT
jgi:hypothetical protein